MADGASRYRRPSESLCAAIKMCRGLPLPSKQARGNGPRTGLELPDHASQTHAVLLTLRAHGRGATCRPYGKDLALQLCNTPVDDLPRAIQQDVLQHSPIMSHQ